MTDLFPGRPLKNATYTSTENPVEFNLSDDNFETSTSEAETSFLLFEVNR